MLSKQAPAPRIFMQFKPAVTVLVTAVALATLLSGCGKKEQEAPPPQTPEVGVVTLKAQPYTLTTELPGRTTAFRVAEVRPQVNGIILKRLFTEGGDVKAGQQLYQIDPSVYEASANSAKATLQSAKSMSDRYKQLVNEQAVSRQEYDTALASTQEAQAALQSAHRSTCVSPRYWRRFPAASVARLSPRARWSAMARPTQWRQSSNWTRSTWTSISPRRTCSNCAPTWPAAGCRSRVTTLRRSS
ncbi:Secretion protein HlyD [Pseudomonas viridiflava]|nr:Secretion protein HlyD [Pseudomonas viridiflava]